MIEAMLFDMDGTVLDTEPIHKAAWEGAMREHGLMDDFHILYECIGLTDAAMKELFIKKLGIINFDEIYAGARAIASIIKRNGIPVKKGYNELMAFLKSQNIRTAIVTSTRTEDAAEDLKRAGIAGDFEVILGFGDYTDYKPHPAPYLTAAERLSVPVSRCLAAEDSRSGLRSAAAAGIKCIYIADMLPLSEENKKPAYREAENLGEIINIIGELNKL